MTQSWLEEDKEKAATNIEQVKQAMTDFVRHCNENTLMDQEKISISLHLEDPNKVSTIAYESPEGKFTVKYNPKKQSATATVDWMTGSFKSTVTDDGKKVTGSDPVYHNRWGILHQAFTSEDL